MAHDGIHIIWFKRDLRVEDHAPLWAAIEHQKIYGGKLLPLYVIEPDYWKLPDTSARQYDFMAECLTELRVSLIHMGAPLLIKIGSVLEVLAELKDRHGHLSLFSHEETGNAWTYDRDLAVKAWCAGEGVSWTELPQHGVSRRLQSRNGWAAHWDRFMGQPQRAKPDRLDGLPDVDKIKVPSSADLGLQPDPCDRRQKGGRAEALKLLDSFLTERGETYRAAMATPVEGETACSRLSPHLAWGTLSMREAAQATWTAQREAKLSAPRGSMWPGSLQSFSARLHWHCHFIQKLEDEPRLEWQNLHPAYDGLRPDEADIDRLTAWAEGNTGLPFLDACMRYLKATGWLNFRMRAMVTAVASYHLWLPWQATGQVLARRFVDYEPGIHWSQIQMQSGTTGINTPRIYNPIKQGEDQDPTGIFTRQWVPELADVPDEYLQAPWLWAGAGRVLGKAYPTPIVDPKQAAKEARDKIWAIRKGSGFRTKAAEIVQKHGSRKNNDRDGSGHRRSISPKARKTNQLSLFEDK